MSGPRTAHLAARLLWLLARSGLSWLLLWSLVYGLMRALAPDPVTILSGIYSDDATRSHLERQMGLHDPALVAYGRALRASLTFDLGHSFRSGLPVSALVFDPMLISLSLAAASSGLATTAGFLFFFSIAGKRSRSSRAVAVAALSAFPGFLLGLILTHSRLPHILGVPAFGVVAGSRIRTLALPAICNALPITAYAILRMKACHEQVVEAPWFRNALAFGHSPRSAAIVGGWPFALSTGMDVLVNGTILGLTSTVAIEYVFGLPGLGTAMMDAIQFRDTPVILVIVGIVGLLTIGLSFLRDVVLVAARTA